MGIQLSSAIMQGGRQQLRIGKFLTLQN